MTSKLLRKMIRENHEYGTGSDDDIGIYFNGIRLAMVEAWFWRYRGKKMPGRAKRAMRRHEKRYARQ
jgi:hypothetical protein